MGTEHWLFLVLISLSLAAIFHKLQSGRVFKSPAANLPPGPRVLPIVGSFRWLRLLMSPLELRAAGRSLYAKLGPAFTLHLGPRPMVLIADRILAHQVLVQQGAVFSDRPNSPLVRRIVTCNSRTITSSHYGPTWRTLRRNLTSQILQSSRVKSYTVARRQALLLLLTRLADRASRPRPVAGLFRSTMFRLLGSMCFGSVHDDKQIDEIGLAMRRLLAYVMSPFNILNFCAARFSKILFRAQWAELESVLRQRRDALLPLIQARKSSGCGGGRDLAYVDTLFDLDLVEGGNGEERKLGEEEIVSLCSEFLMAGTDTTTTALEWILANVIDRPDVQRKLIDEMREVIGEGGIVEEGDLEKLPYLQATVLEGLRRHPQGAILLPHAATEEAAVVGGGRIHGFSVPKKGMVTVLMAEIGWDPEVWEDPMSFRPERFLGRCGFDITGRKGIEMVPFGAGRRMCPGYALALLHLEYFLANLIWRFEWTAASGSGGIDMSEKENVSIVMKYPLQAYYCPNVASGSGYELSGGLRTNSSSDTTLEELRINNMCYISPRFNH
ncbi:unnamed protein product [Linum trigynum]|uniref:Cytochrome P450 n=1 Tax=Linum trigynum TaxID=586398 RepID=A0AAV2D5L3_9ROSI